MKSLHGINFTDYYTHLQTMTKITKTDIMMDEKIQFLNIKPLITKLQKNIVLIALV